MLAGGNDIVAGWVIMCVALSGLGLLVGYMFGQLRGRSDAWNFDLEQWEKAVEMMLVDLKAGKRSTLRAAVYSGRLKEFIEEKEDENNCSIVLSLEPREKGE